ncbi:MAG: radical SAM protein [Holosporaceae bacterium]|jgi:organic radical activating enzyme|nr:radical SAM protein [Holosporaceae bacterium]
MNGYEEGGAKLKTSMGEFGKKILREIVPYGMYKRISRCYAQKISNIFSFEVQLADHCNLNCVGCSHFSPVADRHFLSVDEYEKDCNAFAQLAKKYVREIHLMGGEPLLHKGISEIIKISRSNFSDCAIVIVTNGILLDNMGENFWDVCKSNNVVIKITPYPININVKEICRLSMKHGVCIESHTDDSVYKMKFRKDVYDPDGLQKNWHSFKKCSKKICHHLYNGKFYMCPAPAYIKYINKFFEKDFKVTMEDYIDIYSVKDARTILDYIKKPIPFCRYCDMDATDHNVVWSISKREISEWM